MSANPSEVKSSSANSGPSASRTRISSVPRGCTFRANAAVSTGTSGTPTGRSTHRSSTQEKNPSPNRPHRAGQYSPTPQPRLRQQSQRLEFGRPLRRPRRIDGKPQRAPLLQSATTVSRSVPRPSHQFGTNCRPLVRPSLPPATPASSETLLLFSFSHGRGSLPLSRRTG